MELRKIKYWEKYLQYSLPDNSIFYLLNFLNVVINNFCNQNLAYVFFT